MKLDTQLIHAGEPKPFIQGAVTIPIFQTTTYETGDESDYASVRYARLGTTPNHLQVCKKLAAIEGGEAALVTASGMAAISTTLLALVPEGGHIVAQDDLYGGTMSFLQHHLPSLNRTVSFFNIDQPESLEKAVTSKTKVIYVESISNPKLKVPDLASVVARAKEEGWLSIIDSTFTSPVNFNPIAMGFDVVLHSASKYLNGHGDVIGGVIVGRNENIAVINKLLNHLGGCMAPYTCYLLSRGMRTLGVRVRQQNETALKLAQALTKLPSIASVAYPGLPSDPYHGRAKEWFRGFGGMVTFSTKGTAESTDLALKKLKLATVAPSLGGVETLVTRPAVTTHLSFNAEERKYFGITDTMVRVSVGLEDADDLIADFDLAFNKT